MNHAHFQIFKQQIWFYEKATCPPAEQKYWWHNCFTGDQSDDMWPASNQSHDVCDELSHTCRVQFCVWSKAQIKWSGITALRDNNVSLRTCELEEDAMQLQNRGSNFISKMCNTGDPTRSVILSILLHTRKPSVSGPICKILDGILSECEVNELYLPARWTDSSGFQAIIKDTFTNRVLLGLRPRLSWILLFWHDKKQRKVLRLYSECLWQLLLM